MIIGIIDCYVFHTLDALERSADRLLAAEVTWHGLSWAASAVALLLGLAF